MDASGSVGSHWDSEKILVNKLAREINISPTGGHAAVTMFSSKTNDHPAAELVVKFPKHTTFSTFEADVNALPYWGGSAQLDQGMEVALKEMFHESNGMRPTAPKTLVLITDGQQSGVNYGAMAKLFRDAEVRVITIGIGNANKQDLRDLVAVESDFHLANDFVVLLNDSFIKSISLCDGMLLHIV